MTRTLSGPFVSAITAAAVLPIVLVKFGFTSGDLNLWSGVGVIQWNGEVYTGVGGLGEISGIMETGEIKATNVQFTLSGADEVMISMALAENYQNRSARLWVAVLDSNFAIIADPYLAFSGKMDVMVIDDQPENPRISLTAENDLAALRRPNPRYYTSQDQELEYPGDTFFQYVPGLQDKQIQFGVGGGGAAARPVPGNFMGRKPVEATPTQPKRSGRFG